MTSSCLPETDAVTLEPLALSAAPRAKALIMTFWGDMLLPWGGRIWLGGLVRAMAPFGLDEQNVRASVNRLVQEGWLVSETVGRRRELSMPVPRLEELRAVQSRMYRYTPLDWDDLWRVLVVQPTSPARREAMRRELRWQGYANLAPGTFIHPRQNWAELAPRLAARGLEQEVVHAFEARSVLGAASPVDLWPLQTIAGGWANLLDLLERMSCTLQTGPATAFSMRLLLAHTLRLTVLKDPALPNGLLPADWPEAPARAALGALYSELTEPANSYLQETVERADGSPAVFVRGEEDWRFAV